MSLSFARRLLRTAIRQLITIAGFREPITPDSELTRLFVEAFNDGLRQVECEQDEYKGAFKDAGGILEQQGDEQVSRDQMPWFKENMQ